MKCVIWDIDNCLANDEARIPLIDHRLKGDDRWAKYHAACPGDPPNPRAMRLFEHWHRNGDVLPIFFTGRPRTARVVTDTAAWLMNNPLRLVGPLPPPLILFRGEDDHRSAVDVKRDMLRLIRERFPEAVPLQAYDDRVDIVDMYISEGLKASVLRAHDDMSPHPELHAKLAAAADTEAHVASLRSAIGADPAGQDCWPVQGARPIREPKAMREVSGALHQLALASDIFRERNSVYGDNWLRVAKLLQAIAPPGAGVEFFARPEAHIMTLILMKLSRYAASGLSHLDSAQDIINYAAILADLTAKQPKKEQPK